MQPLKVLENLCICGENADAIGRRFAEFGKKYAERKSAEKFGIFPEIAYNWGSPTEIKPIQTEEIIKLNKKGISAAELVELFNVYKATIYRVLKNQ